MGGEGGKGEALVYTMWFNYTCWLMHPNTYDVFSSWMLLLIVGSVSKEKKRKEKKRKEKKRKEKEIIERRPPFTSFQSFTLNDANTPKARAEVLKAKLALSEEWIAKILKKLQEVDPKFEEEKKTPKPQVAFFKTNKGWWVGFSLCLLALFVSIGGVVWLWIMLRRNHSDTSSASQSVGSV